MPNLTTYKKPELAVISEVKKIREYSDTDKLTIAKNIVDGLLIKLGVSGKSNSAHHVEVIRFIADNKEFTPDEFTKAFDLAIDGELKIDLFQQLNRVVMGRVMVLYKAYKIEKLRAYRSRKKTEKTISDDEQEFIMIEAVDRIEKEYKANKEITGTFVHVYDYLFTQGVLPKHTKAFKSRILKKSKEVFLIVDKWQQHTFLSSG